MLETKQFIKHTIPDEDWPTAEVAAESRWFSPIRIGRNLVAKSRTWVPAMVPWRATEDGFVTQEVLDWYERFAEGKPGVIVVEATGIRDIPSGPLLRIGHDRFISGLRDLVEVVREHSEGETCLFIQIIDFLSIRRRPEREKYLSRFLHITDSHRQGLVLLTNDQSWETADETAIREKLMAIDDESLRDILRPREIEDMDFGARERVTHMDKPHIRDLPKVLPGLFADAVERAKKAGFHGVELHYAHAYTMASFLSKLNTRNDGYGGARENRVRLPLEVFQEVRNRVGDDYPVGCRYLSDDIIEGGSRLEDAVYFGVEFAKAGMDYISISRGGKFEDAKQPRIGEAAYPYTGPSGHECMPTVRIDEIGPFGRNVPYVAQIKKAINDAGFNTPVVLSGGIHSFSQAEEILDRGYADIVASARQSLADPDWFQKILTGKGDQIKRCKFTNYCEGLDQRHKPVTCQLWDKEFTPGKNVPLSKDGKRRLLAPKWK